MVAKALNENAQIKCPHQGLLTVAGKGDANLTAGGANLIPLLNLIGAPISGCTYISVTSGSPLPCTTCSAVAGPSTVLSVGGKYVGLLNSTLSCANLELGPLPMSISSAGQSVLDG